jgi:SagB-type dehydrogenase family enzyme
MKTVIAFLTLTIMMTSCFAQDIKLPEPQKTGGKPLMEALNLRQSQRSFSTKELTLQQISNLLWAASGVNRKDGRMTAPTASNNQQVVIFVGLKDGSYEYLPQTNTLKLIVKGDHRADFGVQPFTKDATVSLAFASDYNKMGRYDDAAKWKYSCTDVGNVSQNVYLFAASEGLSTVVLGSFNADTLKASLKLTDNYHLILTQVLGFPKD